MARDKEYRARVPKTLNFEMHLYEEFQDFCKKEDMSVSKKLQELMTEAIQKNALGSENPIGVSYITYMNQKQKPFQMSLDAWNTRQRAIQSIKELDAQTIENIGLNMIYASRFKKTGIARDVRVF